jgi:hypothetical protein
MAVSPSVAVLHNTAVGLTAGLQGAGKSIIPYLLIEGKTKTGRPGGDFTDTGRRDLPVTLQEI